MSSAAPVSVLSLSFVSRTAQSLFSSFSFLLFSFNESDFLSVHSYVFCVEVGRGHPPGEVAQRRWQEAKAICVRLSVRDKLRRLFHS